MDLETSPSASPSSALRTIVLDAGSHSIKAGFSTATVPECIPSLAGRNKYKPFIHPSVARPSTPSSLSAPSPLVAVGREARDRRGLLSLSYPIEHGVVTDWDAWQMMLPHLEHHLSHTSFASKNIFWVEHPFSSRPQRARVAQIMFEERQSTGMCVGVAPLLALYATGQTTGIVLDVGEGVSSVAASVQGYAMPEMMQREDFGGGAVTHYLQRLLREYGSYHMASPAAGSVRRVFDPSRCGSERELVREIKEQRCELRPDPVPTGRGLLLPDSSAAYLELAGAVAEAESRRHALPDGTELLLGHERFQAPEVLFTPALIGREHGGLADLVVRALRVADVELRGELCQHVYLTGASTLMAGFGRRFLAEVLRRTPRDCKVRVAAPAERSHAAWLGAALISQLSTFGEQMVTTREAYMEEGERALHTRRIG